jgi:hypothetical protein
LALIGITPSRAAPLFPTASANAINIEKGSRERD